MAHSPGPQLLGAGPALGVEEMEPSCWNPTSGDGAFQTAEPGVGVAGGGSGVPPSWPAGPAVRGERGSRGLPVFKLPYMQLWR